MCSSDLRQGVVAAPIERFSKIKMGPIANVIRDIRSVKHRLEHFCGVCVVASLQFYTTYKETSVVTMVWQAISRVRETQALERSLEISRIEVEQGIPIRKIAHCD